MYQASIAKEFKTAAHSLLAPFLLLAIASLSAPAAAVPIPWKNCGKPTDLLSIQQDDASVWPPQTAAPFKATATLDTAGEVTNLHLFLVHGLEWSFDSGPLPSATSAGFVSLPASFPVSVTSPPLPIPAGPYSTNHFFPGGENGLPVTVVSHATLATQVNPPLSTTMSLTFNGTPGFSPKAVAGDVYGLHVQMMESGGTEVFCMDLIVPLKLPVALVSVSSTPGIPLLSPAVLAILAVLVALCGVLAVRRMK